MGLLSKPEVIVLKESNSANEYLEKLEQLLQDASEEMKDTINKEIAITKAGIAGENNILFELKNSGMDMVVLQDIFIETQNGLGAQIDFIVITKKLFYIIECKNLFGNIEIDGSGNFIRTFEYNGKKIREGIYSPVTQNERHLNIINQIRQEDKGAVWSALLRSTFNNYYKSYIVLANPKTLVYDRFAPPEIRNQVIRADQLIYDIKWMNSNAKVISTSKKDMLEIGHRFLSMNKEDRKDYLEKYENLISDIQNASEQSNKNSEEKNEKPEETKKLLCPRCGSELVLRTAKKGNNIGNQFYGCSSFPKCRYIQQSMD